MDYYLILFSLITVFIFVTYFASNASKVEHFYGPTCQMNKPFFTGKGIYNIEYTLEGPFNNDNNWNALNSIDKYHYDQIHKCPDGSPPKRLPVSTSMASNYINRAPRKDSCDQAYNPYNWYIKSGIINNIDSDKQHSDGYRIISSDKIAYSIDDTVVDNLNSQFKEYKDYKIKGNLNNMITVSMGEPFKVEGGCLDETTKVKLRAIFNKHHPTNGSQIYNYILELYPNCVQFYYKDDDPTTFYFDINQRPTKLEPTNGYTTKFHYMCCKTSLSFFVFPTEDSNGTILKFGKGDKSPLSVSINSDNLLEIHYHTCATPGARDICGDHDTLKTLTFSIKLGEFINKAGGTDTTTNTTKKLSCTYTNKSTDKLYNPYYISISIDTKPGSECTYMSTLGVYIYKIPLHVVKNPSVMNYLDYFRLNAFVKTVSDGTTDISCLNNSSDDTCRISVPGGIFLNPSLDLLYRYDSTCKVDYIRNYNNVVDDPALFGKIPAAFLRQDMINNLITPFENTYKEVTGECVDINSLPDRSSTSSDSICTCASQS